MSKTQKKGQCKHKFTQGTKKGKLCKKSCRGQFCCDHNPKKSVYKAKYYQKKKELEKDYKLNQLIKKIKKTTDLDDLPDLQKYQLKYNMLGDENIFLIKKKLGVRKILGFNDDKFINKLDKKINPIPQDILDECDGDENYLDWYMTTYPKKPVIIDYVGTPAQAKKKLKKIDANIDSVIDKIRQTKKIIDAITQRLNN